MGATCRYGLGRFVGERYHGEFPTGTFLINVTGCFALGLLATLVAASHTDASMVTAVAATGFLGGYTTFSTYALEAVLLYVDGSRMASALALVGSLVCGVLAAALGAAVGHTV